eukprot:358069-Pyramimonas_sp.AAC.1
MKSSGKAVKNMKDDVKAGLVEETKRGFSQMAGVSAADASAPLPKAARASGNAVSDVEDMLLSAVGKSKSAAPPAPEDGESVRDPAEPRDGAPGGSTGGGGETRGVDVR